MNGWNLNAFFYDFFNSSLSQVIDEMIFEEVGDLSDEVVIDLCAGTGASAYKAAEKGARVIMIEENPKMIDCFQTKGLYSHQRNRITVVREDVRSEKTRERIAKEKPALLLAKRCLYWKPEETERVITSWFDQLSKGSHLAIVHPEKELWRYCSGTNGMFAPTHFLRRVYARLGQKMGSVDYQLYTAQELDDLLKASCKGGSIKTIRPPLPAYNVRLVEKLA